MKKYLIVLILITLFFYKVDAQKHFSVYIQFPKHLDTEKIAISYNDGKGIASTTKPSFKDGRTNITGAFYSKYATITITYSKESSSFYKEFWVNSKPSSITFLSNNDSTENPLLTTKLTNAFDIKQMGESKMDLFVANEQNDFITFLKLNGDKMGTSDSLIRLAATKGEILNNKRMEFIKKNGNLYYSLWQFATLMKAGFELASLKSIFNTTFSKSFKNSFEGKEIIKTLQVMSLSKGAKAPDFKTKDIYGKTIELASLKGKYVLVVFWASWCGPCIKELPTLRELKDKYSGDKLEIISVSKDSDYSLFTNAVKKYKMDWIQIFNDKKLNVTYNGDNVIPKVFLINDRSVIVYTRDEESDFELKYLKEILSKRI